MARAVKKKKTVKKADYLRVVPESLPERRGDASQIKLTNVFREGFAEMQVDFSVLSAALARAAQATDPNELAEALWDVAGHSENIEDTACDLHDRLVKAAKLDRVLACDFDPDADE